MSGAPAPSWPSLLDCTDRGPRSNLSNAVIVLQHDPQFAPDRLWYDEFLDRVLTLGDDGRPREWRDADDARVTVYLQQVVNMVSIAETVTGSAVRYVASQRVRHCVREHLQSFTWDGVDRIAHAFEDFWGAEPSERQPSDYIRAISANFFLGLVARVLTPGCQLDNMVVFEGNQGIGKARALRAIGEPWYAAASESVMSKDFFQILRGCWVLEIGEMDSFSRAERDRIKLVISTPTDRYRPSFARHARDFPRQCIFAGTTNHSDYGNDDTGLRRFWPVWCSAIDVPGLLAARPQLLAEAVHRLQAGEPWWTTPDLATKTVQRDRQSEDVWTPLVLDYLSGDSGLEARKAEVQIHDILKDACKVSEANMTHTHKLRIGSILRLAGWTKTVRRLNGRLAKIWVAPEDR